MLPFLIDDILKKTDNVHLVLFPYKYSNSKNAVLLYISIQGLYNIIQYINGIFKTCKIKINNQFSFGSIQFRFHHLRSGAIVTHFRTLSLRPYKYILC